MDKETFFFGIFLLWYFSNNEPEVFLIFLTRLYQKTRNCINYYIYFILDKFISNNNTNDTTNIIQETNNVVSTIKYENKYLTEIRKLDKEFKFDEKEREIISEKTKEFINEINNSYTNKINEIVNRLDEITKMRELDTSTVIENKNLLDDLLKLKLYTNREEFHEETKNISEEKAKKYIIDKRLEKLENCYIIELTPLGNVMMIYDKTTETFKYYSDNTIPYRYLEPVARKYVKQFNCRPIFVDMEEELHFAQEKLEKEMREKEIKEEQKKNKLENSLEQKKNVFAKFKSYNKESGTGRINTAPPPKNSIPNKKIVESNDDEKLLLKENANRYSYQGKFANFNFLKKIDRKIVDKKFSTTFADFKKNILIS
jgi:hypothetical protein